MSARRLCTLATVLVLTILGAGLLMPTERELRRTRRLPLAPRALHAWLVEPGRRERWAPAWLDGDASLTADHPGRGAWWDVAPGGLGMRALDAKSALLYGPGEGAPAGGTRLRWFVRIRTRPDPLHRWLAALARPRVEREMAAALERLAAQVDG